MENDLMGSWFALSLWGWGWKLGAFLFAWLCVGFVCGWAFGSVARERE